MSRLTRKGTTKIHLEDYVMNGRWIDIQDCLNKLGRLEDLEEELGCPLEVVFKALKEGTYYISPNGNMVLERSFTLKKYSSGWYLKKPKLEFPLENYKKTWWLKRDKSE